jgi:hypothetical protein
MVKGATMTIVLVLVIALVIALAVITALAFRLSECEKALMFHARADAARVRGTFDLIRKHFAQ